MLAGTPVLVLREGTERAEGEDARKKNLQAARALAESVRSTLGPRGLDKMLVEPSGDVVITNDGEVILQSMEIDNPAAKMLAEVAKAQDAECGDGTKTSVILTGELLKRAEELLDDRIHPTAIVEGYRRASMAAGEALRAIARPVTGSDRATLEAIAQTSMMSKGVSGARETLARLAVDAVQAVLERADGRVRFDRKNLQIVKRSGGQITESRVVRGHVVEKEPVRPDMPKRIEGARIALIEAGLEPRKPEFSAEIRIQQPAQIGSFLEAERAIVRRMVDALVQAGANVVLCEKGIDDEAAEQLTTAGVYAVARAARSDLELIAKATGARLVSRAEQVTASDLGRSATVTDQRFGEDRLTVIEGCVNPHSVALLLRGGTEHVVDEVARSVVDAVSTVGIALEDGSVVTGAGATAVELALRLRHLSALVGGREALAFSAFADALEIIPTTLAENSGMNSLDTLLELRVRHEAGEVHAGVDVLHTRVADMGEVAIEPIRVNLQALRGATETAAMLLRIDDVIAAKRSGAASASSPRMPAAAEA
jgi:archaeal chaperonin